VRERATLLAVTSLYWISLYLYVPVLAPYTAHLGGTPRLVGLVVGAYGLAQLLLRIPLGLTSDRMGKRRPFLGLGFLASALASVGFVLAPDPTYLIGARFISGVSACAWVAFSVLFASYFGSAGSTKSMGYIMFCTNLSVMAATYAGGLIADAYGWLAPFWASIGVGTLGFAAVGLVRERPAQKAGEASHLGPLKAVVRHPELVFAAAVAAMGQYNTFATVFSFVPNYAVSIGASKTELGAITMVATLATSLATLLGGAVLAPRAGPRVTVCAGHLLVAASTAAIPYITRVGGLYISQALGGLGRGVTFPVLMGLSISRVPPEQKATAMGFFQAVYAAGMFIGPVVAGTVGNDLGYVSLFLSTAAVSLATSVVALRLPRGA